MGYNDFTFLSEEKRRGIDAFDLGWESKTQNPNSSPFDLYLQETNIADLENMSKIRTLPRKLLLNDQLVYGKKSNAGNTRVSQLVNNEFNREFLTNEIKKKAQI